MSHVRRAAAAFALATVAVTSLAACSGGDDGKKPTDNASLDADGDDEVTPEEVLDHAKGELDATPGVRLTIGTDDTPDIDTYLQSASGVIIREPAAFEGTASAEVSGAPVNDVGVVSVDDVFYVNLLGWTEFDPDDLCAPDPAQLLDTEKGVSTVLSDATDVEEGESEIDGDNRDVVITTYTGTVPGATVKRILPCSPGDEFDASFNIDNDGVLKSARLTGEFFAGAELTYTITIDEYGVEQEITAP